jgi:tetratricopeptide (TPR) repeat protein
MMASLSHAGAQSPARGGDAPAAAAPAAPSSSSLITQCMNDPRQFAPDVMIDACNTLIASGRWSGKDSAWLYNNIGKGYFFKADYQSALSNYDHALQLDPNDAYAYCGRGITKNKVAAGSGDADVAQARRLNSSLCKD